MCKAFYRLICINHAYLESIVKLNDNRDAKEGST